MKNNEINNYNIFETKNGKKYKFYLHELNDEFDLGRTTYILIESIQQNQFIIHNIIHCGKTLNLNEELKLNTTCIKLISDKKVDKVGVFQKHNESIIDQAYTDMTESFIKD